MHTDLLQDDLFSAPLAISPNTLSYLTEGAFPRHFMAVARMPALSTIPATIPAKKILSKKASPATPPMPNVSQPSEAGTTMEHAAKKTPGAFKTISEAAQLLDVPQHVLRFWESRFPQIKPLKRSGGRRYYRPEDIVILDKIKNLLYKQGYTIDGAKKAFSQAAAPVEAPTQPITARAAKAAKPALHDEQKHQLAELRNEMVHMRDMLTGYLAYIGVVVTEESTNLI